MKQSGPHIVDFWKEINVLAISQILRGMETIYIEEILSAMLKEREDALQRRLLKAEIIRNVSWGYGD